MKYKDIKYYIDKDFKSIENIITYIELTEKLFNIVAMEKRGSCFEIIDKFVYDGFIFKKYKLYPNSIIDYNHMSIHTVNDIIYGYPVLTEDERIIKDIIE